MTRKRVTCSRIGHGDDSVHIHDAADYSSMSRSTSPSAQRRLRGPCHSRGHDSCGLIEMPPEIRIDGIGRAEVAGRRQAARSIAAFAPALQIVQRELRRWEVLQGVEVYRFRKIPDHRRGLVFIRMDAETAGDL